MEGWLGFSEKIWIPSHPRGESAVPLPNNPLSVLTEISPAFVCILPSGNLKPPVVEEITPLTVSLSVAVFAPMATFPTPLGASNTLPLTPAVPAPPPPEPGCKVIEPPSPRLLPPGASPPLPATKERLAPAPAFCPVVPVVLPPLPPEVCNTVAASLPAAATAPGCKPLTCSVAVGGATLMPILEVFSVTTLSAMSAALVNFASLPAVPPPFTGA